MAATTQTTKPQVKNADIIETAPQVNAGERAGAPEDLAMDRPDAVTDPSPETTKPQVENADIIETAPQVGAGKRVGTPEDLANDRPDAVTDPSPETTFEHPSGAVMESEVAEAVDLRHESADANPRAGTSALQNAIDFNDAKRMTPSDPGFAGMGIDESVYGDVAHAARERQTEASTQAQEDRSVAMTVKQAKA